MRGAAIRSSWAIVPLPVVLPRNLFIASWNRIRSFLSRTARDHARPLLSLADYITMRVSCILASPPPTQHPAAVVQRPSPAEYQAAREPSTAAKQIERLTRSESCASLLIAASSPELPPHWWPLASHNPYHSSLSLFPAPTSKYKWSSSAAQAGCRVQTGGTLRSSTSQSPNRRAEAMQDPHRHSCLELDLSKSRLPQLTAKERARHPPDVPGSLLRRVLVSARGPSRRKRALLTY